MQDVLVNLVDLQNVSFATQKEYKKTMRTPAEILVGFSNFYCYEFDSNKFAIDISAGPFVPSKSIISSLRSNFSGELLAFANSSFLNNSTDFQYLIIDPFNKTYNPAKNVLASNSIYPEELSKI